MSSNVCLRCSEQQYRGEKSIQYVTFCKIRAKHFPGLISVRTTELKRCGTCARLRELRADPSLLPSEREEYAEQLQQHLRIQSCERLQYQLHAEQSKNALGSCRCLIIDHATKRQLLNYWPKDTCRDTSKAMLVHPGKNTGLFSC